MSREHRQIHLHENKKTKWIKRDLDETVILLAFFIFFILKEESSSHYFNNEYKEEQKNKNKKRKGTPKTSSPRVISETVPEFSTKVFKGSISPPSTSSKAVPLSKPIPKTPMVMKKPMTIKVPVVLAEPQVTIPILFTFAVEDPVLEIKRVKKNVYLNQCTLLPNSELLFVSGFIKKSLEYASTEPKGQSELSGIIKNVTIKIPFTCTTKIKFIADPIFTNSVCEQEADLLTFYSEDSDSFEYNEVKHSPREQNFKFNESFNEHFFCELVKSEIVGTEFIENPIIKHCDTYKSPFCCNITEKSVLYLTIKILQNQQVILC